MNKAGDLKFLKKLSLNAVIFCLFFLLLFLLLFL